MKFKKTDFGAEIISILTRGMYLDPKDALREYIQNGIDAKANNISVKIRQNRIIIEDNGTGMNSNIMRKAVRLGISNKIPSKDVGFMGIGIYSSFHLCDKLIIYSRTKNEGPNRLTFDFKSMRDILNEQKKARFNKEIDEEELIDLQTFLEKYIDQTPIEDDDFIRIGTRVEIIGVEPEFFKGISKFNEVADYLQQVIPLPFDPEFSWGELIEKKIHEICEEHNEKFELVTLNLQVNERQEELYRPYTDDCFGGKPIKPNFFQLKNDNEFFGVVWGCLNPVRRVIKKRKMRGFLIRKQGFAIGKRDALVKYFGRATFFNRYIGEVILVHPKLLPNASRTDIEYSPLRVAFYDCLRDVASKLNKRANDYQEFSISNEEIDETISFVKNTRVELNYIAGDADKLFDVLITLKDHEDSLKNRYKRGFVEKNRTSDYQKLIKIIFNLRKEIRNLIEDKKKQESSVSLKSNEEVAKEIGKVPSERMMVGEELEGDYNSLVEVVEAVGIDLQNNLKTLLEHIDEKYILESSKNEEDYYSILKKLKHEFEELL